MHPMACHCLPLLHAKWMAFFFCAALLAACGPSPAPRGNAPHAGGVTAGSVSEGALNAFSGEYEASAALQTSPPRSVAVGYFGGDPADWSMAMEDESPPDIVRRAFYNHLASLPFRDVELLEVDSRLQAANVQDQPELLRMLRKDPAKLHAVLGADALVTGQVTHFDRVYAGLASQAAVGCEVEMHSLPEGELLWRAEHVSRGLAGGVSLTPWGLAMNAFSSLWNLRGVQLLREADDLFREMVSTIEASLPPGWAAAAAPKPVIDLFLCLAPEKPLTAGERIRFRLVGSPNCQATASLEGVNRTAPLAPLPAQAKKDVARETLELAGRQAQSAGQPLTPAEIALIRSALADKEIYEGVLIVRPGDAGDNLAAKAELVNPAGGKAGAVYAPRLIDIDAVPPPAPANVSLLPRDQGLRVQWPAGEPGLVYTVSLRGPGETTFRTAAQTNQPQAVVDGLRNFTPYEAAVAARDQAGNVSEPARARGVPLPAPHLLELPRLQGELPGAVTGEFLLLAEDGPFKAPWTVRMELGGALHLGPGVAVRFGPSAALHVEGGELHVYGEPDAPVVFSPQGGSFAGVRLYSAKALLQHLHLRSPEIGLAVRNCAPRITGLNIENARHAGLLLQENASPHIRCSTVQGSRGMGGLVAEGRTLSPHIDESNFLDNSPFQVQNFSPAVLRLHSNYWGAVQPDQASFLGAVNVEPSLDAPVNNCPAKETQ